MPASDNLPDTLRPYRFHGVQLEYDGGDEALADCPWCGREQKFSIKVETGQWRCWVCSEGSEGGGGNVYTFLNSFYNKSHDQTPTEAYDELATNRTSDSETLIHWGLCKSFTWGDWLVPGYNAEGKLNQLYRYTNYGNESRKRLLIPTPKKLGHGLHGVNLYDPNCDTVWLCEGPWDAMALWETLRQAKEGPNGLVRTGNPASSYLEGVSVLAQPGIETFNEAWMPLFSGKHVIVAFDNDHPKEHPKQPGVMLDPAGWTAAKKVVGKLTALANPPSEVSVLRWGKLNGGPFGYNVGLPHGMDVRDFINEATLEV